LIEKALSLTPDFADALNSRGLALQGLERYDEALASYDKALSVYPDCVEALSNRADVLRQFVRYDEALASYDKALTIKPEYAEALIKRGDTLQELKRYDEALASYDGALAIKPDHAGALSNRGLALHELKRYDEALASYDKALSVRPDYAEALFNRGLALHALKRYDEALASYDRVLTIKPDYVEALSSRAAVLRELERYDEALAGYEQALKMKPDYAEALIDRGFVLQRLERLEDAATSYRRALEISPEYTLAHVNLGNVLRDLGQLDGAAACFDQALILNSDFTAARRDLGNELTCLGHLCRTNLRVEGVMVAGKSVGTLTLRFMASIGDGACAGWNRCVPDGNPFLRREFLAALERSGTIGVNRGILPCHAVLEDEAGGVVAAAPGVIKWNNLGETGPELSWTKMLHERRLKYFPNYQLGIPQIAVSTPKLLVAPGWPRDVIGPLLLQLIMKTVEAQSDLSSFHVSRFHEDELPWFRSAGLLIARTPCSVWRNRGYSSFDDWLAALNYKRRYYIQQERKSANASGLAFRILRGAEITPAHWAAYHRGHMAVCARHSAPVLFAPEFHPAVAASLDGQVMLFAAFDGEDFVAGASGVHHDDTLHVHSWSMLVDRPNLSFELVMHRPIAWAIDNGVNKVDGGLAMSYKVLRGYLAEPLYGAHWLRDPVLAGEAGRMIAEYDRDFYPRFGESRVKLFKRDKAKAARTNVAARQPAN